jgi:hypothetical protein
MATVKALGQVTGLACGAGKLLKFLKTTPKHVQKPRHPTSHLQMEQNRTRVSRHDPAP